MSMGQNKTGYPQNGYPVQKVAGRTDGCRSDGGRFGFDADFHLGNDFRMHLDVGGVDADVFDVFRDVDLAAIHFDSLRCEAVNDLLCSNGAEDAILFADLGENENFDSRHIRGEFFGIFFLFGELARHLSALFFPCLDYVGCCQTSQATWDQEVASISILDGDNASGQSIFNCCMNSLS